VGELDVIGAFDAAGRRTRAESTRRFDVLVRPVHDIIAARRARLGGVVAMVPGHEVGEEAGSRTAAAGVRRGDETAAV